MYNYEPWELQGGTEGTSPPEIPRKFAKDGEQPTPQPVMRIDTKKKNQIFVKFKSISQVSSITIINILYISYFIV